MLNTFKFRWAAKNLDLSPEAKRKDTYWVLSISWEYAEFIAVSWALLLNIVHMPRSFWRTDQTSWKCEAYGCLCSDQCWHCCASPRSIRHGRSIYKCLLLPIAWRSVRQNVAAKLRKGQIRSCVAAAQCDTNDKNNTFHTGPISSLKTRLFLITTSCRSTVISWIVSPRHEEIDLATICIVNTRQFFNWACTMT